MANKHNKNLSDYVHMDDIKEIIETVKDKSENLKKKTAQTQKNIHKYAKENPWKAIGFSVLAGIIISKIFL